MQLDVTVTKNKKDKLRQELKNLRGPFPLSLSRFSYKDDVI